MTTGRINQVCQVLLSSGVACRPTWLSRVQAVDVRWFTSHKATRYWDPSIQSLQQAELTAWHLQRAPQFTATANYSTHLKWNTQIAVRKEQAVVSQYPLSFNDHKETQWQFPKEIAVVPAPPRSSSKLGPSQSHTRGSNKSGKDHLPLYIGFGHPIQGLDLSRLILSIWFSKIGPDLIFLHILGAGA